MLASSDLHLASLCIYPADLFLIRSVLQPGVHKTGICGIDGKTNDTENNDKKGGSKPLT